MEKLDVIITSSCRRNIEATIESFLSRVRCSLPFRFLVNVDVLDQRYLDKELAYLQHKGIKDINLNRSAAGGFPANLGRALLFLFGKIESPFFFHLEDDWKFLRDVNLDPLLALMEKHPKIDHIRLNKERIRNKAWLYYRSEEITPEYLRDNLQCRIDNIDLVLSYGWSFNPSLNRSSFVKTCADKQQMLKDPESYVCRTYEDTHENTGTYIYGRIGDRPLVLDTGRNSILQWLRKTKYIMMGGKYAEYKF
ncbi:MAG: hypothetical protein WC547_03730 [Candidatus Omnitrophota bacterium]